MSDCEKTGVYTLPPDVQFVWRGTGELPGEGGTPLPTYSQAVCTQMDKKEGGEYTSSL